MSWRDELTSSAKLSLKKLRHSLLALYRADARASPWRPRECFVLIQTSMEARLQSTCAEAVAAICEEFFACFTSWTLVLGSSIAALEEFFKRVGLWRRQARLMELHTVYAAQRAG